jgi:transglutaminase-like putative cysteine protease
MKKSQVVLFWLRLLLYFSAPVLILIHPGISVTFDRISFTQWFIIIPLLAFIAFVSPPKLTFKKRCIAAAIALLFITAYAGWFGFGTFQLLLAGIVSFTLTYLLFNYPRWAKPAALEPFFLAWICLRLLALSRSGEDAAGQSAELTQFAFVWTGVVFLLHSFVIYLCLFPKSLGGAAKEGALFAIAALGLLALVLFVLPPDFVRNSVIDNLLPEKIPEKIKESSERGIPHESNGRRQGRRTVPHSEDSRQQGLRGISEYSWQNRSSRGKKGDGSSQDNRQYMVMIVAADREPVYMADLYSGQLDPVDGFLPSPQEPLNNLAKQRFFITWFDNEPEVDIGRERQEVIALSTITKKYLPYRPVSIDPTILNEGSGPLRYIHQVVSNTHFGNPIALIARPSRTLSDFEKKLLAPYTDISLYTDDEKAFREYLNTALEKWRKDRKEILAELTGQDDIDKIFEPRNEPLEKILALLVNFSTYQYNLSYTEGLNIDDIKDFLFNNMEGDCVEFSNTLALLGRLAGIPSRVATGYYAAEDSQTQAHLRGLFNLRNRIPFLQQFPLENLFLVTNLHSHSWTQFYIPDYGWLDFEATTFSIPPVGMGDYNNWDVVIPLIDEQRVFSQVRKFPWLAVLRAAVIMAILAVACAYALRYGREGALYFGVKRGGRAGARSLYLLLLARLAADGKPLKPASKTALEYTQLFPNEKIGAGVNPHFKKFASLYTEMRWREFKDSAQKNEHFLLLEQEYHNILKTTQRQGILGWLIRLISLRGLGYL